MMDKAPDLDTRSPPDMPIETSRQKRPGPTARSDRDAEDRAPSRAVDLSPDPGGPAEEALAAPSDAGDRVTGLADALNQQELRIQQIETSLVTRIADVDDDRRITTHRLQRAWQTQRDEIEARLRRQASIFAGALLLLVALLSAAFLFAYAQFDSVRRGLLDDMARLRLQQEELGPIGAQNARLQEQLTSLGASLEALASSWPEGGQTQGAGPTPDASAGDNARPEEPLEPAPAQSREGGTRTEPGGDPQSPQAPDEAAAAEQLTTAAEPGPGIAAAEAGPEGAGPQGVPAEQAPAPEQTALDPDRVVLVGDRRYALQLIGSYSRDAMLDFARGASLPTEVFYREETYQGRPWFVLIHSLHARREDAVRAISDLPGELAALDLWIRELPPETELAVLSPGG